MKKLIVLLLVLLLLAGCGTTPGSGETTGSKQAQTQQVSPSESPEIPITMENPLPGLPWSTAFRNKKAPEGVLHMDEVAFCVMNEDRSLTVENVSKAEIAAWAEEQTALPRTHYYEQFMDPEILPLLPVLDYALAHGFSRLCVPTTEFHGGTVIANNHPLLRTFRVNAGAVDGLSVATVTEEGTEYDCVTVSFQGIPIGENLDSYRMGVKEARRIVDNLPSEASEYEKALLLYHYLTENVKYYDYEEKPGEYYQGSWSLCYDALVEGETVCAGYTEALYCLYNLAGIDCITQTGSIPAAGVDGRHTWNEAKINGEWYLFDSTWDAGLPPEFYSFFGISDETMQAYAKRYVDAMDLEYDPPCPKDLKKRIDRADNFC